LLTRVRGQNSKSKFYCGVEKNEKVKMMLTIDFLFGSKSSFIISEWIAFLIDPLNLRNKQYPAVVVEVGVSQSMSSLHNRAADYLSPHTSIRIYIALKAFQRRRR
jgi:hypothetical protein